MRSKLCLPLSSALMFEDAAGIVTSREAAVVLGT